MLSGRTCSCSEEIKEGLSNGIQLIQRRSSQTGATYPSTWWYVDLDWNLQDTPTVAYVSYRR